MSRQNSTTVRATYAPLRVFFRYLGPIMPTVAARAARALWFAAPPRMAELPLPDGGTQFTVQAQGHPVSGIVWGDAAEGARRSKTVYLMHGLGGRGSQFGALVDPLVTASYQVVMLDAPTHGESAHGPSGPRRTNGMEFAKALDAVCARFGPAEAVVAHSLGVIATYLAMRYAQLSTQRLVAIAPMTEAESHFDNFQRALGFGKRTRAAFDRAVDEWVPVPVAEFDARFQAAQVKPVPTLVIADRGDRSTRYEDVVGFAQSIQAALITTEGLGHRKILSNPDVAAKVVEFVTKQTTTGDPLADPPHPAVHVVA